ncbi:MAG: hypothetical protein KAU14_09700 [Thermoplasmata archaeon]|nr:hypothetical protein [Thermoplasmata archaeon]
MPMENIQDMVKESKDSRYSAEIERFRRILDQIRRNKKPAQRFKNKIEYWHAE